MSNCLLSPPHDDLTLAVTLLTHVAIFTWDRHNSLMQLTLRRFTTVDGTDRQRTPAGCMRRSYDRLVLRDRGRDKKIFFYPSLSPVDSTVLSYIQSNGGRNNVIAQPMWVGQQGSGGWSFFSCESYFPAGLSASVCYMPLVATAAALRRAALCGCCIREGKFKAADRALRCAESHSLCGSCSLLDTGTADGHRM